MTDEPEEEAEVDDDAEYDAEEEFEDRPLSPPDPDMPPLDTYKPVSVKQVKKVDAKEKRIVHLTDDQIKRAGQMAGTLSTPRMRQRARAIAFEMALISGDPAAVLKVIEESEKADVEKRESRTKGRKSRTADRQSKLEMYREALRGKAPRVGGFGSTG